MLPPGLARGVTLGVTLPKPWKGGVSAPTKPINKGEDNVFDLHKVDFLLFDS
jgi:hypothetical protein